MRPTVRQTRVLLGCGAVVGAPLALVASLAMAAAPVALPARTISLNETGHLRLTSRHGFTLNERGSASGTIRGAIYIHLNVVATNRVTAEVNIYPSSGSLTASARAGYSVGGATASFSGTMSIVRGTGTYRHAGGSGLRFSGTIRRSDDAVTVSLSGRMSD
jgi:hypothetical protein